MPGFGSGPFGSGPFGRFDWSRKVLFEDLPEIDRQLDATIAEGRLQAFMDSVRPSFDEVRSKSGSMSDLRDWQRARTKFQGNTQVNVLSAKVVGRIIEVEVENTDVSDPFSPLGDTSIGWILEDGGGREYVVNAVHKLRDIVGTSAGPVVDLKGQAELPVSAFGQGTTLTGLVTFQEGSVTVAGSGTSFLAEVSVGQYIAPADGGGIMSQVLSVDSNIQITLTKAYVGSTDGSVTAVVGTASDGSATLRPPSQIEEFGRDFAIDVDQGIAEVFQRATVRDVHQWRDRKGAEEAFIIIGGMYGYDAEVFGLWSLSDPNILPLGTEVFEIPLGSGNFYTPLAPLRPRFDQVAGDVIPLDLFCWQTLNWTTDAITPPTPSPPDGTSVSDAIGSTMQALTISATTDLGDGRWIIEVNPADLFPVVGIGNWYASFDPMPGTRFFLETLPVETSPGVWEFEILAGTSPTFGTDVSIDYQCPTDISCDFCRASAIRVEASPNEVLNETGTDFDEIGDRIAARMLQAVPAHVRVVNVATADGVVVNGDPVLINGDNVVVGLQ